MFFKAGYGIINMFFEIDYILFEIGYGIINVLEMVFQVLSKISFYIEIESCFYPPARLVGNGIEFSFHKVLDIGFIAKNYSILRPLFLDMSVACPEFVL
jgi:hypothetical protein